MSVLTSNAETSSTFRASSCSESLCSSSTENSSGGGLLGAAIFRGEPSESGEHKGELRIDAIAVSVERSIEFTSSCPWGGILGSVSIPLVKISLISPSTELIEAFGSVIAQNLEIEVVGNWGELLN